MKKSLGSIIYALIYVYYNHCKAYTFLYNFFCYQQQQTSKFLPTMHRVLLSNSIVISQNDPLSFCENTFTGEYKQILNKILIQQQFKK